MLNSISIMGRLVRDPEMRNTQSGIAVTSFTVAVDRDYTPKGAEKETDFIDCVIWRQGAEFVNNYFKKGDMIGVTGRLQVRSWEDQNGSKRKTAEVMCDHTYFCGSKTSGEKKSGGNEFAEMADDDGGLPF